MALDAPLAVTGLPISALEARRAQAALLAHDDAVLGARAGVLHGLGVSVSGLSVTVASGSAVITPGASANGSYVAVNAADLVLTAAVQDATYARLDRVIARVYDTEVDASGLSQAAVEIVTGTPAASPVLPALPAGALSLSRLSVPSAGSDITSVDERVWTSAVGAPIYVASAAALPYGAWLRPGQMAYTDAGVIGYWDGVGWKLLGTPTFASTGAMGAAIPSPAVNDRCFVGTDEYRCITAGAWKLWSRPETAWTPEIGGVAATINSAMYTVSGGKVDAWLRFTLTGAPTGSITFLPPLAYGLGTIIPFGQATLLDTSATARRVWNLMGGFSTTLTYVVIMDPAGSQIANATNPWTWASGDVIHAHLTYVPAL